MALWALMNDIFTLINFKQERLSKLLALNRFYL